MWFDRNCSNALLTGPFTSRALLMIPGNSILCFKFNVLDTHSVLGWSTERTRSRKVTQEQVSAKRQRELTINKINIKNTRRVYAIHMLNYNILYTHLSFVHHHHHGPRSSMDWSSLCQNGQLESAHRWSG